MIKNNVQCFVATQVTACIQICNKEERQERREKAGEQGGGSRNSEWGWRGGGGGEDNQSQYSESSLCSKFRDGAGPLWGCGGKGVGSLFGRERGMVVVVGWEGGPVWARAQSCIQWG